MKKDNKNLEDKIIKEYLRDKIKTIKLAQKDDIIKWGIGVLKSKGRKVGPDFAKFAKEKGKLVQSYLENELKRMK